MTEQTIAAGLAISLLDFACKNGADRTRTLANAGLIEAQIESQDLRIPMMSYHALVQSAVAETGDTALMMRQSLHTDLGSVSILGLILQSVASLKDGITQLNRFGCLVSDLAQPGAPDRFELRQEGPRYWLYDHFPYAQHAPHAIEETFCRVTAELRRADPELPVGLRLEVSYPAPPHAKDYETLLGVPTHFDQSYNRMELNPVWVEREDDTSKAYVFGIFADHAEKLVAELAQQSRFSAKVEAHLLADLHRGNHSMESTARALGVSRGTLYRRLQEEGVTFAELHDTLRSRMARDYLSARRATVNETAYLLGFSEASSFVRAFKRWTGMTPSAFAQSAQGS